MTGLLILFICLFEALGSASEGPRGILVEEIRHGSTADRAGLETGDVLLSWSRAATAGGGPAHGVFRSPFDWTGVLIEQVPRGPVSLAGKRGETARTWVLPGGAPSGGDQPGGEVAARPVLTGEILAAYSAGGEHLARGELDAALGLWRSAAARARAQGEPDLAVWLTVRQARALAAAERWLEADTLYEKLIEPLEAAPGADPRAIHLLREWGRLWLQRRLWDRAEDCFQRALTIARKLASESLATAWSLTDLGDLATRSGGARDPDALFLQALDIRQRLAPGSSEVASSWRNLGSEALTKGDFRAAEEKFRKALAVQERVTPGQIYVAERLLAVAAAKYFQKDFSAAEALYQKALAIAEREAPEDRGILGLLQGIGSSAAGRGDWRKAEEALLRAVRLGDRLVPESIEQMHLLYDLGLAQRRLGKREPATDHLCRALQIVERRRKKSAGNQEIQLTWSFRYSDQYRACAQGLAESGKPREAFEALERGRARSFLYLLIERDLRFSELPAERAAEWNRLTADYESTQGSLEQARARNADQHRLWSLEGRLREIRRNKERILAENLPLSSLRHPDPLDLDGVRQALDPGTVLLFYAVGTEQSLLFAVKPADQGPSGVAAFPLPLGNRELAARIGTFRDTLIEDRFNREASRGQARRLYADLLAPAEAFLAGSQRLLIVPDGPLHLLPFAALRRQDGYLIEWKPLHFAVSVTAYAQLQKRRRPREDPGGRKLVAFGDPFAAQPARDAATRAAGPELRRSARSALPSLPGSRAEVEELARLFPQAQIFLQGEATEENAKRLTRDVHWLHFAVHGLLNEQVPINSALVLSAPPEGGNATENGLLQAWEIMEDLRLDADLVTLSACDTALGTEVGGEGLIGLTRAFQYAGASSVLATLWGITDKSTAPWMSRFYRELRDGRSKDEALRAAQLEQIGSPDGPYPFYWAAFQLYGDWR